MTKVEGFAILVKANTQGYSLKTPTLPKKVVWDRCWEQLEDLKEDTVGHDLARIIMREFGDPSGLNMLGEGVI